MTRCWRHTLSRRRRGAVGIEAVLAFPTLLILFGAVAQIMILGQARTYVEGAAYAAARSAMVYKCRPFDLLCTDQPQKWEDAARWALIGASSPSDFAKGRGACPDIAAAREALAGTRKTGGFDAALANAICYAYEPGNVTVDVAWDQSGLNLLPGATAIPIRAKVRFKTPLSTPFRRFVSDGKRGDGTYWRWGEATVVLR